MKKRNYVKIKSIVKRASALMLAAVLLGEMIQPTKATNIGVDETNENKINLLEVEAPGFSKERYESVMLQGEKQGELAAFTLSFQVKRTDPVETEYESSVETESLTTQEVASTEPITIETDVTETVSSDSNGRDSLFVAIF